MCKIQVWPIHPRRLPDELLSSWLMRIAQTQGIKLHSFTHRAFPNYSVWNRDIDKTAPDGLLTILAQHTGRPFTEVYQSTLKSYEGYLFETLIPGNTKWILPVGVYHRIRKKNGLTLCPLCLATDNVPYFRRLWRIGFTVICTKHSIWMIDECPICKHPICFHRNDFKHKYNATERSMNICYNCGFDYTKTEFKTEDDQVFLAFLKDLEETLNNGYIKIGDKIIYAHLYFYVLHQLVKLISISKNGIKLRHLLESESNFAYDDISYHYATFVDALTLSARRHFLRLISRLLNNWPQSFIQACEKVKLTRSRLEKDMKVVPFWYSDVLRNNLDATSYGPSEKEIQAAHYYLKSNGCITSKKTLLQIMGLRDSKVLGRYWKNNS